MKATSIFLGALLTGILLVQAAHAQGLPPYWKEHLEILKKGYVPRDYDGDLKELQLTDYVYKGKIETREQLAQIVDSIFADNAPKAHVLRMVEERDTTVTEGDTYVETRIIRKRYPKFEIRTIRQLIDEGKLSADSVAKEKQLTMEYTPMGRTA